MKTTKLLSITILLLATIIQSCSAHKNKGTYTDFYKEYKRKNEFVSFNIPPGLFGLFISKDDKELKQFFKSLDDIKILSYENNADSVKYFTSELKKKLPSKFYNDLMVINDGGDKVEFKIRERDNKVNELLIIVTGDNSFSVVSIKGEIELDKVTELSKTIDIKGLKHLNKN